jgi:catechol 2,3-dioxygenase-like lactoylglutathione lyase family enzyme
MHFNHLGLPVRDERRSLQFYSVYFGFDPASAWQYRRQKRIFIQA